MRAEPIGAYRYREDDVTAFVLEVDSTRPPAEPLRNPTWFGFEAARSRLTQGRAGVFGAQMERVLLAAQRAAGSR